MRLRDLTEISLVSLLQWLDFCPRKFRRWQERQETANEHHVLMPKEHWIEPLEKERILAFAKANPLVGYRELSFLMLDADVAAVSSSTTYRVLKAAGLIAPTRAKPSKKGSGFVQPTEPHEHWHVDFSYLNIGGVFYFLCCALDGCSRAVIAWDIRVTMCEQDCEIVLQKGREQYPKAKPRVISDQGAQFKSREFKSYIRQWQASHVLTSPYYPQSNGKVERFHKTLKHQAIYPKTPLSLEDAKRVVAEFILYYNNQRLHSALGYLSPADRLEGRHEEILAARANKLETARQARRIRYQISCHRKENNNNNKRPNAVG